MIYKKFQDIQISALGYGLMRLPFLDNDETHIDEAKVAEMVDYAYTHGVNYFDTAWGYHSGCSEIVTGKCLSKYPRDTYYLATKFPGYDNSNFGKVEEIFEQQLKKCGVDYFDFYLFHNVAEHNIDDYLNPDFKTYEYLVEQKRKGRIRHLGFSAHGSRDVISRFIDAYGKDLEFCQLQVNYMDWHYQNACEKIDLITKAGIPLWVMEPVRGGRLASASEEMTAKMKEMRPDETVVGWTFRFLQSLPEATVILSGMSTLDQVKANVATFEEDKPLTAQEANTIIAQMDKEIKKEAVPCTGCRYCTSHCPQGLEIPELINIYNQNKEKCCISAEELASIPADKLPGNCVGCHSCERVCPQGIRIADILKDFASMIK